MFEICWEDKYNTLTSGKVFSLKWVIPSFSPLFIYLLAKTLKSRRFKLLSILEFISLGRDSSQDTSLAFSFSQPIRFKSHTKLPVTPSAAVLGPAQMSHAFLLWTTLNFAPGWDEKFTKQVASGFLYSPTGVVSRIIQVFPHCLCPLPAQGCLQLFRWSRPRAGETHVPKRGREISEGLCWASETTPGRPFQVCGGTLSLHYMKALGACGDINHNFLFTSFLTNRHVSTKIRAKLKSKILPWPVWISG